MLLYDTHTGKSMCVETEAPIQLVRQIYKEGNLGSIVLNTSDLRNPEIQSFVDVVVKNEMGKLQNQAKQPIKPVIFLPILSLNLDVDKFKDKDNVDMFLVRDISKYLLEANIILNNTCQQGCKHCHGFHKQFFCCSKGGKVESLLPDSLVNLLRQLSYFPVRTINISGGNIYQYPRIDLFDTSNGDGKKVFNFYIHYLNYQKNQYIDSHNIHLIINEPIDINKLREIRELTKEIDVKYHLVVENEEQYGRLEMAMTELGIEEFEVHPYYNGQNIRFFEENVYLATEDIVSTPISMREIFRNQKLNANSFGSMYFLPNGEIKANPNEETIGNIRDNRIIDVIHKEMIQNTAWRQVRSSNPCGNCVFQFLCPPLSNYERVLRRYNLCHVSQ
jgi:pseudo-rSAM protein